MNVSSYAELLGITQRQPTQRAFTPTLAAWPSRGHTALKSILWETLLLDQLHDFSLLFLNSFLHPFYKLKFMKKILNTKKKFRFFMNQKKEEKELLV